MNRRFGLSPLTMCLGALLFSACRSTSTPVTYYSLRAMDVAPSPVVRQHAPIEILLTAFPASLERTQIVSGEPSGRLRLSENHRWACALEKDFQRVLADNLSTLMDNPNVFVFPAGAALSNLHRVNLDVQEFGGQLGGTVRLKVGWLLFAPDGKTLLASRRSVIQETAQGKHVEAFVAAHNRALGRLGQELATELAVHTSATKP